MRQVGWVVAPLLAIVLAGCGHSRAMVAETYQVPSDPRNRVMDSAFPSLLSANYLLRPDGGERRVLRQLMHEMQQARHLIDEAHARRDAQARVRVDYARLALEFDQILLGLRRTLSATETTPREASGISGEYRLYE